MSNLDDLHIDRGAGREMSDASNIQYKRSALGTIKTEVGTSAFYTKRSILTVSDSTVSLEHGDHQTHHLQPIGGLSSGAHSSQVPGGGGSVKIKKVSRIYDGSTKFPKLHECAHFHYEFVAPELKIQVSISDENQENIHTGASSTMPGSQTALALHPSSQQSSRSSSVSDDNDAVFELRVISSITTKSWILRRSYEDLRTLDSQLHRCIYDRRYSQLSELRKNPVKPDNIQLLRKLLSQYLKRFTEISGSMINCGPVLSWFELDNHGNRLIVSDDSAINTPAVAAAHVVKRYIAQAPDEISFQVGDIISLIDMPPADECVWWRGKKGFEVGFFPAESVQLIKDKDIPNTVTDQIPETPPKPVLRKRGKLISFLRTFFTTRPARSTLKRTGIVRERVFGCDLGEHLLNSGLEVPLVLKCCALMIETHGITDGIYRLSGITSNIQKLRNEFDEEGEPDLETETYLQDIHSISSLLKMYFRELPNPLLTYQLYDPLAEAVQSDGDDGSKLMQVHDVIQQLPPPHYRTAQYLVNHLARVAQHKTVTNMHCKNLAIVWAPNLLRSKELELQCTNAAALHGVGVQAIVTEYLISFAAHIFSDHLNVTDTGVPRKVRPKSLVVSTPTKLLSLEEARSRAMSTTVAVSSSASQGAGPSGTSPKQKYIDVGGGPSSIPANYHTVIEVPYKFTFSNPSTEPGTQGPGTSQSMTPRAGVLTVHDSASKKSLSRKDRKLGVQFRSLFSKNRSVSIKQNKPYDIDEKDGEMGCLQKYTHEPTARVSQSSMEMEGSDEGVKRRKLRSVKSADSLLSVSSNLSTIRDSRQYSDNEDAGACAMSHTTPAHSTPHRGSNRGAHQRSVSYDSHYYSHPQLEVSAHDDEEGVFLSENEMYSSVRGDQRPSSRPSSRAPSIVSSVFMDNSVVSQEQLMADFEMDIMKHSNNDDDSQEPYSQRMTTFVPTQKPQKQSSACVSPKETDKTLTGDVHMDDGAAPQATRVVMPVNSLEVKPDVGPVENTDGDAPPVPERMASKKNEKHSKKKKNKKASPPLLKPRRSKSRSKSPEMGTNSAENDLENDPKQAASDNGTQLMTVETGVTSMEEFLMAEKESSVTTDGIDALGGQAMASKSDIYLTSTERQAERRTLDDSLDDSAGNLDEHNSEDHVISSADSSLLSSSAGSGYGRCTGFSKQQPMSPLGEMLTLELEDSPRSKKKLLAKLSKDYDDIEVCGSEGGRSGLADTDLNPADSPEDELLLTELHADMFKGSTHQLGSQGSQSSQGSLCNLNTQESGDSYDQPQSQKTPVPTVMVAPLIQAESYNSVDRLQEESAALVRPVGSLKMDRRFRKVPGLMQAVDLRRSMEDGLDTPSTMDGCSIGSFNELSQSLDSLLKDVQPGSGAYEDSRRNSGASRRKMESVCDKTQITVPSIPSVVVKLNSNDDVQDDLQDEVQDDVQDNVQDEVESPEIDEVMLSVEESVVPSADYDDSSNADITHSPVRTPHEEPTKDLSQPLMIHSVSGFNMTSDDDLCRSSLSPMLAEDSCVDVQNLHSSNEYEPVESSTDDLEVSNFSMVEDVHMTSRNASKESLLSPDKELDQNDVFPVSDITTTAQTQEIVHQHLDRSSENDLEDLFLGDNLLHSSEPHVSGDVFEKQSSCLELSGLPVTQDPVCSGGDALLLDDDTVFGHHGDSSSKEMLASPVKSSDFEDLLLNADELHSVSESQSIPSPERSIHRVASPMERTPSEDGILVSSCDSTLMDQGCDSPKPADVHIGHHVLEPLRINTSGLDMEAHVTDAKEQQHHVYEKKSPTKSPAGNLKIRSSVKEPSISPTELEDEPKSERKRNPPQRKKSVKELLSKFETGSPPSDGQQEVKFRPLVYNKPRVVKVQPKSSPVQIERPDRPKSRGPSVSPKPVMSTSPRALPSTPPKPTIVHSSSPASDISVSPSWSLNRSSSISPGRDLDSSVSPGRDGAGSASGNDLESHLFSSLSGDAPIRDLNRYSSSSNGRDFDGRRAASVSPGRELERPATTSPSWAVKTSKGSPKQSRAYTGHGTEDVREGITVEHEESPTSGITRMPSFSDRLKHFERAKSHQELAQSENSNVGHSHVAHHSYHSLDRKQRSAFHPVSLQQGVSKTPRDRSKSTPAIAELTTSEIDLTESNCDPQMVAKSRITNLTDNTESPKVVTERGNFSERLKQFQKQSSDSQDSCHSTNSHAHLANPNVEKPPPQTSPRPIDSIPPRRDAHPPTRDVHPPTSDVHPPTRDVQPPAVNSRASSGSANTQTTASAKSSKFDPRFYRRSISYKDPAKETPKEPEDMLYGGTRVAPSMKAAKSQGSLHHQKAAEPSQETAEEENTSVADRLKLFQAAKNSDNAHPAHVTRQASMHDADKNNVHVIRQPSMRSTDKPTTKPTRHSAPTSQGTAIADGGHPTVPTSQTASGIPATTPGIPVSTSGVLTTTPAPDSRVQESQISSDQDTPTSAVADNGTSAGVRHLSKMFERCGSSETGGATTGPSGTPPAGAVTKPPWSAIV